MDEPRPFDLDSAGPAPSARQPRRNAWQVGLVAGALIVAAAGAGGALAVSSYLSGAGAQPDDVVRGGAMAFARVDMDPSASQKLAVWQLSKRLPDVVAAKAEDGVLRELVGDFFVADIEGSSYERDVEPWLGDRVALVVYPPANATSDPITAVAAKYTDSAAMEAALTRLDSVDEISWATRDGYVVVSDQEEGAADLLASPSKPALAAQETYRDDVAALGGNQLAVGWLDAGALFEAGIEAAQAEDPRPDDVYRAAQANPPKGRLAFGVRASSDTLDVVGRTFGAEKLGFTPKAGRNLAGSMPADSVGALSIASLPALLVCLEQALAADPEYGDAFTSFSETTGLDLSKELTAFFGEETALAALAERGSAEPGLAVRTRGGDATRVEKLMGTVIQAGFADYVNLQRVSDGFVIGSSQEIMRTAAGSTAKLGDSASFARAVPDAEGAAIVGYLSFPKLIELGVLDPADAKRLEGLDAVGVTVGAGDNPSFRIRLTTR